MASLRDQWLADPEQISYAEWLRRRTVPPTLLVLQSPAENAREQALAVSKPKRKTYPRKSRAKGPREQVHGSTHAWKRHRAAGEDPCAECVTGHAEEKVRRAADKRTARALKRREPARCGTPQKARKHRRDGEEVCEECREGERAEWRRRSKAERDERREEKAA